MSESQKNKGGLVVFVELLKRRPYFRRIWWSQILSQLGDWFCFVALLALVLELTGRGLHISFIFLATAIPSLLLAPLVGVVADRYDRRLITIGADVVRALASLAYLFVDKAEHIWAIYVLVVVGVIANCFFSPSINAAIPQFVDDSELTLANSLLSATGGIIAALSAWIGGVVATAFGRDVCFIVDSLSFSISAWALYSINVAFQDFSKKAETEQPRAFNLENLIKDCWDCWNHICAHYPLDKLIFFKAVAGIGGALMALLSVIPVKVLQAGDYGVGVMYGSRGLGTLLGALVAGIFASKNVKIRTFVVGFSLICTGLFSVALGWAQSLCIASSIVLFAYACSGVQWVLTSALLQQLSDDDHRGRVFSLDNLAMTCTASISALIAGIILEDYPPCWIAWGAGGFMAFGGVVLLILLVRSNSIKSIYGN